MLLIDYGYSSDSEGERNFGEEKELIPFLENRLAELESLDFGEDSRHAYEQNEEKFFEGYVKDYTINPLVWHVDGITVSQKQAMIDGKKFPAECRIDRLQSHMRNVVSFHLPFSGDIDLVKIRWRVPTSSGWNHIVHLSNNSSELAEAIGDGKVSYKEAESKIIWEIAFDIIDFGNDTESIVKERDDFLVNLQKETDKINAEVEAFNSNIEKSLRIAVNRAKEKYKRQNEIVAALGNPRKG
ncbi:MAG: hypothetical protein WAN50_05155 [Minisyncoccia bacterium]